MNEEAHYWYVIRDFEKLIDEVGADQVMNDLAPFIRMAIANWIYKRDGV